MLQQQKSGGGVGVEPRMLPPACCSTVNLGRPGLSGRMCTHGDMHSSARAGDLQNRAAEQEANGR